MSQVAIRPTARLPIIAEHGESNLVGPSEHGSHQLAAVNVCPQAWWYRYGLGYRVREEPPYRLLGTLGHVGLAYWYASQLPTQPHWYHQRSSHEALVELAGARQQLVKRAEHVLGWYAFERYVGESTHPEWPLKPLFVETSFSATLGELDPTGKRWPHLDKVRVSYRADLVVEDMSNDVWVMDYKFQGYSPRKDGLLPLWHADRNEYIIDWQQLLGLAIIRKRIKNRLVRGMLIRRIKREEPYDSDTNPVPVPERVYARIGREARRATAREDEARGQAESEGDYEIDQNYWACKGTRYGPCDYRPVCSAPSPYQALRERFVQLKEYMDDDDTSYDDA